MKQQSRQAWIGDSLTEILFILLPPFFSLLLVIVFPSTFQQQDGLNNTWWVILILLIDVAHVYSTLYRTYFDGEAYREHKNKLLLIPFLSFVAMVILYTQSSLWFWRVLAYTAVFHFIRQQYGFMRIYSRKEPYNKWFRRIDGITIYVCTVYPLAYWHLSGNRNFNWFVDGDFFNLSFGQRLSWIFTSTYITVLIAYVIKEICFIIKMHAFNLPRNTVVAGTALSWYFGIVYFNGDIIFTLLNVVSHGIPYMALIWLYGKKKRQLAYKDSGKFLHIVFSKYGILIFLGIIFGFAFVEEGLWDMTLWKEHLQVFRFFHFSDLEFSDTALSIIVPLLALPQVTHYIIDGFIWRIKQNDLKWSDAQ
jgi:phosphatidylglycerophosphate synthase